MTDGGGAGERPREALDVLRPGYVVLGPDSLVPATNLVRPAPQRPTHELVVDAPYRLVRPGADHAPDGVLPAGTQVAVVREVDDSSRVVTASGLAVDVRRASLRELPSGT